VKFALSLALLTAGTAHASGLVFTIELDKPSVVLYEPVTVQCRLANPTSTVIRTIRLLRSNPEEIRFSITHPDGTTREHRQLGIDCTTRFELQQDPGNTQAIDANLHWNAATRDWTFPTPGTYRMTATVWAGTGEEAAKLESNTVEIRVTKPRATDASAIAFFATKDDFLRLLRDGTYEYCRGKTSRECLVEMNEFLRRFHASAYSPDLVWDLWSRRAPGLTGFDTSDYALFWDFERFLKEWPRDPSAPRVMYRQAMILAGSQRFDEAREVLKRLEQNFPKQEVLARHLREIVEWRASQSNPP
jgi:hypothetical protein